MRWSAVFLVLLWCRLAHSDPAEALPLEDVLAASSRHFPEILNALAERQMAASDVDARLGDFDLVFEVDGRGRLSGFYDGRSVEVKATRPLRTWGASVYGSYSLSGGDFPIYEDEYFTNTGGRLKVGVMFALLRDRAIDSRRFGVADARQALQAAELQLEMTRIGVQRRAIEAYWRWVDAGRKRQVYDELLTIALARGRALVEQVGRGAKADIQLTENRRNITRRSALSLMATAEQRRAANRLSLYYRDAAGLPVLVDPARLPPARGLARQPLASPATLRDRLSNRPEVALLRVAAERARQRLALTQDGLQPKLDLRVEVGEPFGAIGPGGPSRDTTDTMVALTLTVPLAQRTARAELSQSRARLRAIEARSRLTEERLQQEMNDVLLELDLAAALAELAEQEVAQADALVRAENRRFDEGASDFFLVNVREEEAATARIGVLDAQLRRRLARAEYDAATMDLERLGLATVP